MKMGENLYIEDATNWNSNQSYKGMKKELHLLNEFHLKLIQGDNYLPVETVTALIFL